ncbi:MAG TPA: hypothetical protein VKW70_00780 [Terriglobia bacterium]|nr:hypothetical protein [Terriglobia bacterium]
MPSVKKASISHETVERLAKELLTEAVKDYETTLEKVLRSRPGTDQYESHLCDLSVAASWLGIRSQSVQEAVDEYLDSLPDDDD